MTRAEDKWFSMRTDFFGTDAAVLGIYELSPRAIAGYVAGIAYASRQGIEHCHRGVIAIAVGQRPKPAIDQLIAGGFLVPRVGDPGWYYVAHEGTLWRRGTPLQRRPLSKTIRAQVMERDGYECVVCTSTDELTIDHIWPYSKGGSDALDNLRVLCRSCNSQKGARTDGA